jgi:prophage tail gpP-like protein
VSLRLSIDGRTYEGWIKAKVDRGLDQFANRFSLSYLDRWTSEQQPWPIRSRTKAVLSWNDEVLIDGYVDRPRHKVDAESWSLEADGRSLTGQLVDCSAVHDTGHWNGKTAQQIVADICRPFGIEVSTNVVDFEPFNRFTLREGETAFDAIDRVCKIRALLPRSTPKGLQLFSTDVPGSVLPLDVASATAREYEDDSTKRYSEYLVRATGVGSAEEAFSAAVAKDTGVEIFRPLVVVGDAPARTKQAKQRAIWEANVRSGRGEKLSYRFLNPLNKTGKTYSPGQFYRVSDDLFGVDEIMIVQHATLSVDENSIDTQIELVRPGAYSRFEYDAKRLVKKTKKPKRTRRGSL